MEKHVDILKALAEETRLRIMHLLISSKKELCCCELTDSLEEPEYKISRHLKILKQAGLIRERREGRWIYSAAAPAKDQFMRQLLAAVEFLPTGKVARDEKNLKARLQLRVDGKCVRGIQKSYLTGPEAASR